MSRYSKVIVQICTGMCLKQLTECFTWLLDKMSDKILEKQLFSVQSLLLLPPLTLLNLTYLSFKLIVVVLRSTILSGTPLIIFIMATAC